MRERRGEGALDAIGDDTAHSSMGSDERGEQPEESRELKRHFYF